MPSGCGISNPIYKTGPYQGKYLHQFHVFPLYSVVTVDSFQATDESPLLPCGNDYTFLYIAGTLLLAA